MWFKNLALFRFTTPFTLPGAEFESRLAERRFRPCGRTDQMSAGWVSPTGQADASLAHVIGPFVMVSLKQEEKILPSAVVNEQVAERVTDIELREGRKPGKRERSELRDQVILELMPRAFSHSRRTHAYLDSERGWLIVDSASGRRTDDLTGLLRSTIGELPIAFPATQEPPAVVMTRWLANGDAPSDITIEQECELRAADEDGGIVRCRRQDLGVPEIQQHLAAGKQAVRLALRWEDRLSFTLDDRLGVRRLRFLETVQERASEIETDDAAQRFDADFSIMSLELAEFLPRLLELFGGERRQSV
jgi:recombination associated protein RdgC